MFVVAAVLLSVQLIAAVPPSLAPWLELTLSDPPGAVRDWKQRRAAAEPPRCLGVLASGGVEYAPVPDRATGPGCGFHNAVRLTGIGATKFDPVTLSCRATLALAIWERETLQPAALQTLGQPVRRIEHFGTYACRGVYGRENARRSSHATADAFDFAGVVLADGRRLRVARDHRLTARSPDPARTRFLDAIEAGACAPFSVVLGPGYNAAHRDHFHLEWTAGWRFCR